MRPYIFNLCWSVTDTNNYIVVMAESQNRAERKIYSEFPTCSNIQYIGESFVAVIY